MSTIIDVVNTIVNHLSHTNFEDIPEKVVLETKISILDLIASMYAGTTALGCREIVDQVLEWGGKEESTLFNSQIKVPGFLAALTNATMARAVDYDDVFEPGTVHASASVVPAAFAAAEMTEGVSGKDFLTAVALGVDLLCRMSLTNNIPSGISGMNTTFQYAYFACAAAAGKIMRFDEQTMTNALGLAYTMTSGNSQNIVEGTLATRFSQGLAAQGGIYAAVFAKRGITAAKDFLEGKCGYYNAYQRGDYDIRKLLDNLGKVFYGVNLTRKKYPCCMHSHAAIDAVIDLATEYSLKVDDIKKVSVKVNAQGYNFVCYPLEKKRKPVTVPEAQFSLPYVVAMALMHRDVNLNHFKPETITNSDAYKVAEKIDCLVDEELTSLYGGRVSPAVLEVTTKDGNILNRKVIEKKGSPQNPFSIEEIINKLEISAGQAANITCGNVHAIVDAVLHFEDIDAATSIIKLW